MNPPPEESWDDVIARLRSGDAAAAEVLVARLEPMVARTVQAHRPARDEAADLMQEVFLRVFKNLPQYHGGFPFPHWVSRIAVNLCTDRLRHHGRRPAVLWSELTDAERAVLEGLDHSPPDSAELRDARVVLDRLMASLPPPDRALLTWLELEQQSVAEVGARTGMSRTLVRVRAFRARRRLASLFQQLENPNA